MLIPRRVKHRKQHHPKRGGRSKGGTSVAFGDYGIQAMEPAYVTNRQIEAARIAMTRYVKRGGKLWIRMFPDKPVTALGLVELFPADVHPVDPLVEYSIL